ncbi:MAG: hypothetical protein ACI4DU_00290, partial [Lachnospiraceae bacterium]
MEKYLFFSEIFTFLNLTIHDIPKSSLAFFSSICKEFIRFRIFIDLVRQKQNAFGKENMLY